MRVSEPNLTLTFTDLQMQAGGSDCGAFALAFAICYGHSPGKIPPRYMRAHFIECLEKKQFMMFPIRKAHWQGSKIKSSEIVPVHCICHMPEIKQVSMIRQAATANNGTMEDTV